MDHLSFGDIVAHIGRRFGEGIVAGEHLARWWVRPQRPGGQGYGLWLTREWLSGDEGIPRFVIWITRAFHDEAHSCPIHSLAQLDEFLDRVGRAAAAWEERPPETLCPE